MSKSSKDLLSFLFLESAEADADELNIEENLEQLFEAAAEAEEGELQSKKTPLAKALGEFGIDDAELVLDPEGFFIGSNSRDEYANILTILSSADAMHKLAEMGWVVTKPGDQAMSNEPPEYKIRFLEITVVDTGDKDKPDEKVKEITKKAREFATTPLDRDNDDLNPVDNGDDKIGKRDKGVGDAKDGEQPEGKPKGSEKAIKDALESGDIDKLIEMTTTGSMGSVSAGPQYTPAAGIVKKAPPYGKGGTKFKTPGQWKVKQPIVKGQEKRHPQSEALGAGSGESKLVSPDCAERTTEAHAPHEMTAEEFLKEPIPGEEPPAKE
jgi:hypothetical protein